MEEKKLKQSQERPCFDTILTETEPKRPRIDTISKPLEPQIGQKDYDLGNKY